MNRFSVPILLAICIAALPAFCPAQQPAAAVRLATHTELGVIEVEIDPGRAPITSANFLRYVDAGHFAGGVFHRTVKMNPDNQPNNRVKIEVIQGGPDPARKDRKDFPPIPLESTSKTGVKHLDGTISMARDTPDSATSDFFICIGDQPELDFGGARNPDGQGFAAFGRVIKGIDIVRRIQQAPAEAQKLAPPIRILRIARIS